MFRLLVLTAASLALATGAALADPKPDAPPIILAAFGGDAAKVKQLLASGVSADTRDASNFAPLNWAAYAGHVEVTKVLVEAKADINAHTNSANWTPLMNATGTNHTAVALYLIEHGADVMPIDAGGHSALSWAADSGQAEVVKALVARGSDSAVALISNVRDNDLNGVRLLVDSGANVNATAPSGHVKFTQGETALLIAANGNNAAMVSLLLTLGADPNIASPQPVNMTTPLMWAAYHCNGEIARALVARGAALGATNQSGNTALDLARSGWTSNMEACGGDVLSALGG
jgi:ankyrin repeat protein